MKISFIDLDENYIEQVRLWRNSKHVAKYMINDKKITFDQQKLWFDKIKNDPTKKYLIVIFDNHPIGLVNFININNHKSADWGFYIGEVDYLSKGLGKEIMKMAIKYAFNNLNLKSINAEIISNNLASIYLHKKLGFIEYDLLKNAIKKDDNFYDLIKMIYVAK